MSSLIIPDYLKPIAEEERRVEEEERKIREEKERIAKELAEGIPDLPTAFLPVSCTPIYLQHPALPAH